METEIIQILAYAVVIIALVGANAALLAFGLPQVDAAYNALWATLLNFAPILRRIFDPGTRLAKALEAKGVSAETADKLAEMGADLIEKIAKPYITETAEAQPKS